MDSNVAKAKGAVNENDCLFESTYYFYGFFAKTPERCVSNARYPVAETKKSLQELAVAPIAL